MVHTDHAPGGHPCTARSASGSWPALALLVGLSTTPLTPGRAQQDGNTCDVQGENRDCPNGILAGANLAGTDLTGANLSGTDLSGANLSGVIPLHANLTGVTSRMPTCTAPP